MFNNFDFGGFGFENPALQVHIIESNSYAERIKELYTQYRRQGYSMEEAADAAVAQTGVRDGDLTESDIVELNQFINSY